NQYNIFISLLCNFCNPFPIPPLKFWKICFFLKKASFLLNVLSFRQMSGNGSTPANTATYGSAGHTSSTVIFNRAAERSETTVIRAMRA
ncbi:hypothetical protein MOQ31_21965, partial [Escherichia coli]|uniref:hypothetical protein n=1 Tax=Escherichia coli TaxID=562 RepID=UPI002147EBB3